MSPRPVRPSPWSSPAGDNAGPSMARPTLMLRAAGSWSLRVDQDGTLTIPALGEELIAQQLPEREAADLAALLALAAVTEDHPMPAARGDQPGTSTPTPPAARAGADHPHHRADGRPPRTRRVGTGIVVGVAVAAAGVPGTAPPPTRPTWTPSPRGSRTTSGNGSRPATPTWMSTWRTGTTTPPPGRGSASSGPIQVRAQGDLPAGRPRLAWHTEVVTYLATRPSGATVEEFGTALWPDDPDIVEQAETAELDLRRPQMARRRPEHRAGPPAREHPHRRRRLPDRRRPARRGTVPPAPAPRRRPRRRRHPRPARRARPGHRCAVRPGGAPAGTAGSPTRPWTTNTPRSSSTSRTCVATHHLAADEPALAATAAQVAILAGSSADTPLLDLIAACDALGNTAEADAYIKRIMANHDAEVEEDLPPRTAAILRRRQWLPPAA